MFMRRALSHLGRAPPLAPAARCMGTGRPMHYPEKKLIGVPMSTYKHEKIRTSPMKLNLIAKLIRRLWIPEALAQLTFLNKRFAPVVYAAVNRAADRAGIQHELVPEELYIERCFITPAPFLKRIVMHAKGFFGIKRKRSGHLTVVVAKVDFEREIKEAKNRNQRLKWEKRWQTAKDSRVEILGRFAFDNVTPPTPLAVPSLPPTPAAEVPSPVGATASPVGATASPVGA
ncbi:ribosomal protein L22/L17 [Pelagophyceae sp. CCMP2097]|nr:ribosomal protein L22/L17 [Pelagophyceae sp. CCMP2097]